MPVMNVKLKVYFFASLILFFSANILFADQKLNYSAPSVIPRTSPEMLRPGFWIARHPAPDQTILSKDAIRKFNQQLIQQNLTKDITGFKTADFSAIDAQIRKSLRKFELGSYYDAQGNRPAQSFFDEVSRNIPASDSKQGNIRYGIVTVMTNQRLLPTDEVLTSEPYDVEFDEIQNSSLDIGTPVVILKDSADQKWVYVYTSASAGWVKKEDLAFCDLNQLKLFLNPEKFIVITSAKADLFKNQMMTDYRAYARMGTSFPVKREGRDFVQVLLPTKDSNGFLQIQEAFFRKSDVNVGFLPYTPRTIIDQAFKLLNAPYGWGGLNGQQDCSAFLREIFGTVGIDLPRNSGEQGQAGTMVKDFSSAMPGITVGQMQGHIILFLGMQSAKPYAIHEVFAYREPHGSQDRARVVNRVIVSDLDLGEGSKKGSLLERIKAIREMR